ncbi:MAG: ligase-associated DNA damage response exonuclease [Pseudobacteriovorax sp.]|nr:ligase-associated DNA damage response exonuclease [Pseudobacteriovorax sp.]
MLEVKEHGLYCALGDFFIDPTSPVERAVITHAHADHAVDGSTHIWAHEATIRILEARWDRSLARSSSPLKYKETTEVGEVGLSLHSAGHVLGSSQVRLDDGKEIWVVTGDYKRDSDRSCDPFEVVPCHRLVTEATFALPVFKWQPIERLTQDILRWSEEAFAQDLPVCLFAYSLGKTQRLMAELSAAGHSQFLIHRSADKICQIYREFGFPIPDYQIFVNNMEVEGTKGAIIIGPPVLQNSRFLKKHKNIPSAFVSGWMALRGMRRRRRLAKGFIMSDHADWQSLIKTVEQSQAKHVYATHGYSDVLSRYLNSKGSIEADELLVLRESAEDD